MIKEEAIEILSDMRAEYNIFSDDEKEATRYHALSWAIQALNERTWRWIPCSERYPEPDERVLVTDGYCCYVWDCMSNRADAYFWEDESCYYHNKYDVVAWMPIPEPYKEGK